MSLGSEGFFDNEPGELGPSDQEQQRFRRLHDELLRNQPNLRGQQQQLWTCMQAMKSLTSAVIEQLATEEDQLDWQLISDLSALQALQQSVEVLLEKTGEISCPDWVEAHAEELVGELAPDPLSDRRLWLNQLLNESDHGGSSY